MEYHVRNAKTKHRNHILRILTHIDQMDTGRLSDFLDIATSSARYHLIKLAKEGRVSYDKATRSWSLVQTGMPQGPQC